jgi:hypothetical protein
MQLRKNTDQFDEFRREHQRVRAKRGSQNSKTGYENSALRELEQQEAAEERDQQLTREVHDFFAAATRQAAAIVEKVSHDAEEQASERMQGEVEGFLMDTLSRMNNFVMTAMHQRQNADVAETHVEPDVKHLVGSELDEFRYAGSPQARDNHIGQDPFATQIEDVQREFRAVVAEMDREDDEPVSIDGHLVDELRNYDNSNGTAVTTDEQGSKNEEVPEQDDLLAPIHKETGFEYALTDADTAPEPAVVPEQLLSESSCTSNLNELQGEPPAPTIQDELETFKSALKALVRQGVMQREEARAAWNARLQAIDRVS